MERPSFLASQRCSLLSLTASLCVALTSFVGGNASAADEYPVVQASTMLDRLQIEDVLNRYIWALEGGTPEEFASYFAEDAVFDVNGLTFEGRKKIHDWLAEARRNPPPFGAGRFYILMNNVRIVVKGDTATVKAVWTGVMSDNVRVTPRLIEAGHYDDTFVKQDGKWYFKRRNVTSDGGMPQLFDKTYKAR